MRVRVLAFARLRELLGHSAFDLELNGGATAADVWKALGARNAAVEPLSASTRIAINGRVVGSGEPLADGDELALLPPVGGG